MPTIHRYSPEQARNTLPALVHLLQDAVDNGASIGFLPPLSDEVARAYWLETIAEVSRERRILLLALQNGAVVGMCNWYRQANRMPHTGPRCKHSWSTREPVARASDRRS